MVARQEPKDISKINIFQEDTVSSVNRLTNIERKRVGQQDQLPIGFPLQSALDPRHARREEEGARGELFHCLHLELETFPLSRTIT